MTLVQRMIALGLTAAVFAFPAALPLHAESADPAANPDTEAPPVLGPQALRVRELVGRDTPAADALVAFYDIHEDGVVWDQSRFEALVAAFDGASAHGLPPARYGADELRAMRADPSADPLAVDVEVSKRFLTYARDVNSGLLEPRSVDSDLHVYPRRPDQLALLEGLAAAADAAGYLAALAPSHPDYLNMLAEKVRLEDLVRGGGWGERVPTGSTLRPGDAGARVGLLRARLARMDGADYGDAAVFDDVLTDAVKRFQLRHGLNDDGVVGPKTLEAINESADHRLAQVLVNLERQRWLNYDRGTRHIYVNQADFSVRIIDRGKTTYESRVVVGQLKHRTQEFNDQMTHMVVNPTWHVPRSIATEEMLPKLKRNPTALGGSMQIMTRSGTRINPALVDFTQFTASNFPFVVKQQPGGGNALGRVKFMFPNQFNIYLHDTPSKSLFSKDLRAFSHGCVRVQKPFELAHALLAPQSDDPDALFRSALNSGRERQIDLETPVPIYLTYQSAWIDDAGVPQFRADFYGRDRAVIRALAEHGVHPVPVEG